MSTATAPATLSFDGYLRKYGPTLGRKAINSLKPLHIPGRDLPYDFIDISREPFDPQAHVITGAAKMLDHEGNGFIVGEMGTGKTLMGMLSIHKHAKGMPYRCLVLCPDHLITTWVQEIEETIPGAIIRTFENWKGILDLFGKGHTFRHDIRGEESSKPDDGKRSRFSGTIRRTRKKWQKPEGAEWIILGRNQSKFEPDIIGVGAEHRGYAEKGSPGKLAAGRSVVTRVVGHTPMTDIDENPVCDPETGEQIQEPIFDKRVICPSCGMVALGPKGVPASPKAVSEKRMVCEGHFLVGIPRPIEGLDGKYRIPDGRDRLPGRDEYRKKEGQTVKIGVHNYKVVPCGEQLWNFTRKPYRYPPATIMQRKLKGVFKYLIIDEVHEQKSDESAQSMAAGKLMGCAQHVLALTGTLIGGYAEHLFPLLLRMTGRSILNERFEWGKLMPWSQRYGRVDRIVTTKQDAGGTVSRSAAQVSMRKARTGRSEERQVVRPGIMPTLYGKHMMGSSIFIMLEELADELPDMNEYVGGPLARKEEPRSIAEGETPEDYADYLAFEDARYREYESGWFDTAVEMDDELEAEYKRIEFDLVETNQALMARGNMALMGTMLWTLMDYPDRPYGWRGEHPDAETVGYYEIKGNKTSESYRGVTSPADLGEGVRNKERRLVDICKKQKEEGRQSWVYVQMTGKRDVQPRLKRLLEAEGLKVCVLRSKDVKPIDRKEWIDINGPKYDVIISNPTLVATGLTLFSKKDGGHNFATLIFYETGYNLFTLRQAARRAWRIGQPHNCRVYYLYYKGTMQQRAMTLMSKKMAAAAALEGEFSAEGLIGMSEEDSAQMALARCLKDSIDDADANRGWTKLKSRSKPKKSHAALAATASVFDIIGSDDADKASEVVELIGQTMMEHGVSQAELDADLAKAVEAQAQPEPAPEPKAKPVNRLEIVGGPVDRPKRKTRADKPAGDPIADIMDRFKPKPQKPELVVTGADGKQEDEPFQLPTLTREQLAKMFANMKANGMTLDDFN